MKGKISHDGYLEVSRPGGLSATFCPFRSKPQSCGDWCPLFGEPVINDDGGGSIVICQNRLLVFEQFTDERENDENA